MSTRPIRTAEDLREVTGAGFTVSAEQWAAISAPLSPGVVIAGAGSGKTELMSARVVYLVANGLVRPDQVLGLTFTTKATAELGARIRGALARTGLDLAATAGESGQGSGEDAAERLEPTVATYHSYAGLLLREHGLRVGYEPDLRVLADAARFQLAARAIARHRGEVTVLTEHPPTAARYLLALEAAMSEHLVDVGEVRRWQAERRPRVEAAVEGEARKGDRDALTRVLSKMTEREELLDLVEGYRALKQRHGVVDFSDQIASACELARLHPDVGRAEREKYAVVLLDEYQDTSVAQAQLLSALFSGPDAASGLAHPVTAVGDPNQAIYGWRGASVSNILRFGESFPSGSGEVPTYPLTVNRRSDRRILALANALAAPLYDDAAARAARVRPLVAKPEAGEGEVRTLVHRTHADELTWLGDEVLAAHERFGSWREIGVLARTNEHAAEIYDALSAREVPVEIVGLGGLIRLPEVAEVVATLTLLEDPTANPALLTLLAGPRWAIGQRDLALLGRRSRDLTAGARLRRPDDDAPEPSLDDALQVAVTGADPAEISSLADALADPGDLPYSEQARERFGLLAAELRTLRAFVGEPLLDLLRRIIDVTGLDVELASSVSAAAGARRENLETFVRAVADFEAVDGQVTLAALMAWLQAEDEFGEGLDAASPTEADSVKLLTVHRAKGLEYDAVFLVGVGKDKFPVLRMRSQWTTRADVLPAPLRGDAHDVPQLREVSGAGLTRLREEAQQHQAGEELRLAYVAFTRARHLLWVSSAVWGSRQKPIGPSAYQETTREVLAGWGERPDAWYVAPDDEVNPVTTAQVELAWPVTAPTVEAERRLVAAQWVRQRQQRTEPPPRLDEEEAALVAAWDHELERLLQERREAAAATVRVPLPDSLSATALSRVRADPAGFARDLARPMPRRPVPQARFGTRFHAWVEARSGQQPLLDPDELPGRGDHDIEDDTDLKELQRSFETGPYALRTPIAVESPFALVLEGQVVRGRIDAVFAEEREVGPGYLLVDWKTGRGQGDDPLQLAVYRVAWAELSGVPVERVRAVFHHVRDGVDVEPADLPDRAGLEELVRRGVSPGPR